MFTHGRGSYRVVRTISEDNQAQQRRVADRRISIALNIWKQSLEAENKRLKEVLPAVQRRYEALVKQRNALVSNVNKLREALNLAPYISETNSFWTSVKNGHIRSSMESSRH
ncbi:hypothetical protein COOONC_11688 [Cooperia oncophora]